MVVVWYAAPTFVLKRLVTLFHYLFFWKHKFSNSYQDMKWNWISLCLIPHFLQLKNGVFLCQNSVRTIALDVWTPSSVVLLSGYIFTQAFLKKQWIDVVLVQYQVCSMTKTDAARSVSLPEVHNKTACQELICLVQRCLQRTACWTTGAMKPPMSLPCSDV